MALGRYDHISVSLAVSTDELLKVERAVQFSNFASSHWSCFGRVLASSWQLDQQSFPAEMPPLIGICGIKLSGPVRAQIGTLEAFAEAIQHEFQGFPGHWLLSSTTGWEDAMLICWCDSFTLISSAASRVRGLSIQSIAGCQNMPGKHAILTTCTIPGIEVPDGFLAADNTIQGREWIERVGPRLASAPVDWVTRFELRPGHLDAFVTLLSEAVKRYVPHLEYVLTKIFGQYDLRLQCKGRPHADWLQFILEVALPLATREGSLVRAMETLPQVPLPSNTPCPHSSEGFGASAIAPVYEGGGEKLQRELETIASRCRNRGVAPHTIEVLRATRARLASLGDDELHRRTFFSVERIFASFAEGLQHPLDGNDSPLPSRALIHWLHSVERCLADRYRGTYPIGDALVPRLGSYQASHHGFLQASDALAQSSCDLAVKEINRRISQLEPAVTAIPEIAICCELGNSPSPFASSLIDPMRCGFIELPPSMIFQMRDLASLLHEVGHIVANAFFLGYPLPNGIGDNSENALAIDKEIAEILAEAFSCVFCFAGSPELQAAAMVKTLATYLPQNDSRLAISTAFVYNIRHTAVQWLMRQKWQRGTTGGAIRSKFFSHVWDRIHGKFSEADTISVQGTVTTVSEAFARLARFYDTDARFRAYIDALNWLASDVSIEASNDGQRVVTFRRFIVAKEEGQSSQSDDFRVLEELCAKPRLLPDSSLAVALPTR